VKRHLVLLYWLLLLVSTLAIGGLAFFLLQRESDRLRKIASDQAVHTGQEIAASLNARVERVKMETMQSLAGVPEVNSDPTILQINLPNWKEKNPIARSVILYQPGYGLLLPLAHTSERAELEPLLHNSENWAWGDTGETQQVHLVMTTITTKIGPGVSPAPVAGPPAPVSNPTPAVADAEPAVTLTKINGVPSEVMLTPVEGNAVINSGMTVAQAQLVYNQQTFDQQTFERMTTSPNALGKPAEGWSLIGKNNGDERWLGWKRTATGGPVRGVVLSWTELAKSMSESFPARPEVADSFQLLNPAGEVVVASGENPVSHPAFQPLATLPLAAEMPGWKLAVYFNPSATFTNGYLAISTVMVTILVIIVLVGGTLLMREARREAAEAIRKTSFVSNVSHELKTPLTTIRMYAELLGDGRVRDQLKQNTYLATIISESQRLTRLVNNVLDFSRLEQGRKQYNPTDVALAPIIDAVINAQKPRLDEAGFTIVSSIPAGPEVRVHADRDALEQVLLNLIDNALKYAAPGRWIGIRVTTDDNFACIIVSDRGPGVPTDHHERIFETFHRVDDSITASQPGAGLGLSIARRLLRDQEGDLTYENHEPQGASFVAKLPLASAISAAKIA
jgi:signal transduction histidine kinase